MAYGGLDVDCRHAVDETGNFKCLIVTDPTDLQCLVNFPEIHVPFLAHIKNWESLSDIKINIINHSLPIEELQGLSETGLMRVIFKYCAHLFLVETIPSEQWHLVIQRWQSLEKIQTLTMIEFSALCEAYKIGTQLLIRKVCFQLACSTLNNIVYRSQG
jgi:hypothetical protein